jgi:hypothetical protein
MLRPILMSSASYQLVRNSMIKANSAVKASSKVNEFCNSLAFALRGSRELLMLNLLK